MKMMLSLKHAGEHPVITELSSQVGSVHSNLSLRGRSGNVIAIHRPVLASISPLMLVVLRDAPSDDVRVSIPDASDSVVMLFVRLLYCGRVDCASAADYYSLVELLQQFGLSYDKQFTLTFEKRANMDDNWDGGGDGHKHLATAVFAENQQHPLNFENESGASDSDQISCETSSYSASESDQEQTGTLDNNTHSQMINNRPVASDEGEGDEFDSNQLPVEGIDTASHMVSAVDSWLKEQYAFKLGLQGIGRKFQTASDADQNEIYDIEEPQVPLKGEGENQALLSGEKEKINCPSYFVNASESSAAIALLGATVNEVYNHESLCVNVSGEERIMRQTDKFARKKHVRPSFTNGDCDGGRSFKNLMVKDSIKIVGQTTLKVNKKPIIDNFRQRRVLSKLNRNKATTVFNRKIKSKPDNNIQKLTNQRNATQSFKPEPNKSAKVMTLNNNEHIRRNIAATTSNEPIISCNLCQKRFSTEAFMLGHQKRMHRSGVHKCTYCSFSSTSATLLQSHRRSVHIPAKNHACPQCSKCFSVPASMKRHIDIVHLNIKPFVCEICPNQRFSVRCNLERHMRNHTGEKPYGCICGAFFRDQVQLRSHVCDCKILL